MDDIHKLPDFVKIKEDTPEDIKVVIETFFEATKMIKDGYVERNIRTKPYSYSITRKGRQKLGLDQTPAPEIAPQTA